VALTKVIGLRGVKSPGFFGYYLCNGVDFASQIVIAVSTVNSAIPNLPAGVFVVLLMVIMHKN